jgi:hypothetical protein
MANLTLRRNRSKKQRAASAVGKAAATTGKVIKARIAWLAGKKATKVAAPAVAVGTAAVVAKKRFDRGDNAEQTTTPQAVDSTPTATPV